MIRASTYNSSEYLQSSEAHIQRYVGWGVVNEQRDGDKAKVDEERENVEHKEPLEEQEVGEDAGAKLATYLLYGALPQLQGLPGWPYTVATPAEILREQLVTCIAYKPSLWIRSLITQKMSVVLQYIVLWSMKHSPVTQSQSNQQNMWTGEIA